MGKQIKNIELAKVKLKEDLYPRAGYNWQTGYDYSESMKAGGKFPPITLALHRSQLILVDGLHRLEANKINKKKVIKAEVYIGWDYRKIFEEAIKRNINHGRPLSPYEKRNIALKLRKMKYGNKEISKLINVSMPSLNNFISSRLISSITGKVLSESIVKSGLKHLAGRKYKSSDYSTIREDQKLMYINEQVYLLETFITLIKDGLLDTEDEKIDRLLQEFISLI